MQQWRVMQAIDLHDLSFSAIAPRVSWVEYCQVLARESTVG
jgi:hypothetical protein